MKFRNNSLESLPGELIDQINCLLPASFILHYVSPLNICNLDISNPAVLWRTTASQQPRPMSVNTRRKSDLRYARAGARMREYRHVLGLARTCTLLKRYGHYCEI